MNIKTLIYIFLAFLVFAALGWFFFFRSPHTPTQTTQNTGGLGVASTIDNTSSVAPSGNTAVTPLGQAQNANQKIFKIADGPVTNATFVQMIHPTSTSARYVLASNGHVFDLTIDSPGAVPRAVSNTTIPGSVKALWGGNGTAAILQYIDLGLVKTLSLSIGATTTVSATSSSPVRIQFFPDGVRSVVLSPDNTQAAYLLPTTSGVDGFISKQDGSASKKLFSLALSEVTLLWPTTNTLLLQTKSSVGMPGIVFSVDAKSGAIVPLLYADGVSATANRTMSHLVYQTNSGEAATSYVRDTKKGTEKKISFNPIPEKCVWSTREASVMYCALPLEGAPENYVDLWRTGRSSLADSIISYNLNSNTTKIVAVPGGDGGGVASDISELALSQDEHYLLFVTKGNRAVWGVRLAQ